MEKEIIYEIEDSMHGQKLKGGFKEFEHALEYLRKTVKIPWDKKPNKAPCMSWKTCQRKWEIIKYDVSEPYRWEELGSWHIVTVSKEGVAWSQSITKHYSTL